MTAELHRIGPWRALVIVAAAAALAAAGWSASGIKLHADQHTAVKLETTAARPAPATPAVGQTQNASGHTNRHTSKPHRRSRHRRTRICTRADGSKVRRPLDVSCQRLTPPLGSLDQQLRERARRQHRRPTPPASAVQSPAPTPQPSTTPRRPAQGQPQNQTTPSASGGTEAPSGG